MNEKETEVNNKSYFTVVKENFSLFTSLIYILGSAISLIYNAFYYSRFGIDYIFYVEISDIFLSIRNISIISIFIIVMIVNVLYLNLKSLDDLLILIRNAKAHQKNSKTSITKNYIDEGGTSLFARNSKAYIHRHNISFIVKFGLLCISIWYLWYSIKISTHNDSTDILSNSMHRLTNVVFKTDKYNDLDSLQLIGNTSKYHFFYESKSRQSIIVPSSEILFIKNDIATKEVIKQDSTNVETIKDTLDVK